MKTISQQPIISKFVPLDKKKQPHKIVRKYQHLRVIFISYITIRRKHQTKQSVQKKSPIHVYLNKIVNKRKRIPQLQYVCISHSTQQTVSSLQNQILLPKLTSINFLIVVDRVLFSFKSERQKTQNFKIKKGTLRLHFKRRQRNQREFLAVFNTLSQIQNNTSEQATHLLRRSNKQYKFVYFLADNYAACLKHWKEIYIAFKNS
eukprot:TRINITY_DN10997_c0_g1_i6.p5 TRINITY_DN10997_c0_g1~~TRINITY_DN10997_c0_g1_i6.p5  ORF type:complete len:204 (+),score=-4.82 TRINITY_DN10997_c0_g1_i6:2051-2662(+)